MDAILLFTILARENVSSCCLAVISRTCVDAYSVVSWQLRRRKHSVLKIIWHWRNQCYIKSNKRYFIYPTSNSFEKDLLFWHEYCNKNNKKITQIMLVGHFRFLSRKLRIKINDRIGFNIIRKFVLDTKDNTILLYNVRNIHRSNKYIIELTCKIINYYETSCTNNYLQTIIVCTT